MSTVKESISGKEQTVEMHLRLTQGTSNLGILKTLTNYVDDTNSLADVD